MLLPPSGQGLEHGSEKAAQRALQSAIQEKSRYVAERIARTEAARARYDAFIARYGEDDSVVAYRWKLGSRHPAEDICDMYAHADLYGQGAGIFPKDQAPVSPAHPHCLCHYAPVYTSELKGKKRSDNVEGRGNAWLKRQPLHIRQAILGVKGEQEWKAGRVGWMEKARNLSDMFGKAESRIPLVNEASHEQRWGDFNHYGGDTVKVYEGKIIPRKLAAKDPISFDLSDSRYNITKDPAGVERVKAYVKDIMDVNVFECAKLKNAEIIEPFLKHFHEINKTHGNNGGLTKISVLDLGFSDFAEVNGRHLMLNANYFNSKILAEEAIEEFVRRGVLPHKANLKFVAVHEWAHLITQYLLEENPRSTMWTYFRRNRLNSITMNSRRNVYEFVADAIASNYCGISCKYAKKILEFFQRE